MFYVKTNNVEQTGALMRQIEFNHPVIIDHTDIFYLKNKLPEDKRCQTFLVDQENKIILIGNPIYSDDIKKLYIRTIKKYHL